MDCRVGARQDDVEELRAAGMTTGSSCSSDQAPRDFGKLIADETEKWGKVIRAANIKPE
jgi:hypothetical protein